MPNNFEAAIKLKLMSETMADKSYRKVNNSKKFIVIHNMAGTSAGSLSHWNNGAGGAYTSAHYCVDDKEIWQTLKDQWVAHHCGAAIGPAGKRGCNNETSIGIEIADMNCDQKKAVELGIELARHLITKHNIPYENLVSHKEVSSTECPKWIYDNNLWDYFKREVKRRNDEQIPLQFDPSQLQTGDTTPGNNGGITGTLPNFDNREDWTNLKEIKGVTLVCMPPFHFNTIKEKDKAWAQLGYDKQFHYLFDGKWDKQIDKTLIAKSIQDNNRHTYIERALYSNQSLKYTLNIGMFIPDKLNDYPSYEKKLIDEISKVIYENKLEVKDLWREFDFNRAPSPFMYLDREQWKLLLREVDKIVKWRYKNFGEPTLPEKDPSITGEDFSKLKNDIGKKGYTIRYCMLRENPTMTAQTLKALEEGVTFEIIDSSDKGFYKVKLENEMLGWIISSSVKVTDNRRYIKRQKDNGILKPEINATMTHEEYLAWQALTDPKLIDEFVSECEPYDKGLKEIIDAAINNDDRLSSLTKQDKTINNNSIHYSVTEGSPGDTGHCVKPAAELNILFKPETTKVDPIYPDLIVPPNYAPAEHNINQQNPIPMATLEDGNLIKDLKDFDNNQLTFDYELLNEKKKQSKGKPVNYLDPYPYDDKIIELETHNPKIKIDSIEARLYESNHPGDPMPQPIAKNFALVYDAMLKQSSNIETRLVRIENVLSHVLRNLGRVGSRVNVNCVYYGGQDTFGKYKTIRCLCDDRIHDAGSVTLDQCLSCTRYEPILGQVYDILDDTGMNGSVYLDNMQMAYMELEDLKNLNRVERRSTQNTYANVNKEIDKPESQFEAWEEADKQAYIETLKKKITDEKELEKKIEEIKQEDYAFKMNWYEQDLDLQEPDVKPYPLEGIKLRYKKTDLGNKPADSQNEDIAVKDNVIDDETDQDYIKDLTDLDKLNNGEWVDTREKADTIEINEYSSEDYFFEDFNVNNASFNGSPGGIFGAEARLKIVEKAKEIVELHKQGKAGYSWVPRTIDDTDRKIGSNAYVKNAAMYDCSSFTSCCYKYAGLNSLYNKNTNAGVKEITSNGGEMWLANEEGLKKALPGDVIYTTTGRRNVTQEMMGKYIDTEHVMVYIGDNKVAHASTDERPVPNQIKIDDVKIALTTYNFFARPKDLIEADKKAQQNGVNSGGAAVTGTISTTKGENFNTIYSFAKAVCSAYTDIGGGAGGVSCNPANSNVVAAHNMPYGTVIYIKELDGKAGGGIIKDSRTGEAIKNLGTEKNGVFYVGDTGGPYFDFDINTHVFSGKTNMDVLVLEWGTNSKSFWSFTDAMNFYDERGEWPKYPDAVRSYRKMNGCTINFHKFKDLDKNINQNPKWNMIK